MRGILIAVCAAALAVQVVAPGFIGLANNGDFGRVYGWLCLAPVAETNFVFFQPAYRWSARNYWDSPYHSSESALAWVATRLAGAAKEGAGFDIRWLGAIHAAFFVGALAVLLTALRGAARWAAAAAIAMFTDVSYTAYLNSFYMDAAALCGLLPMTACAVWMAADRRGRVMPVIVGGAAALLFVTSKAQHAVWMLLPAAGLIAATWRAKAARWAAWSAAAAVIGAGAWMLASTDLSYRGQAMFNVVFYRLAARGENVASVGVRAEELRYRGMHAYVEGAPAADRQWTEDFYRRTGFARLAQWYGSHPARTAGYLREMLTAEAWRVRPAYLGNFKSEDGRPAGARTERFGVWSELRSAAMLRFPWLVVVWYAAFLAGCARSGSRVAWVGIGLAALGIGEFTAASLGDSLDGGRHLLVFHAVTDLTLCFAVGWACGLRKDRAAHAEDEKGG